MIDPRLPDVRVDRVIIERLPQELKPALEVAAEDRRLCVSDAHRPSCVFDVGAEKIRSELVLAIDQTLAILALEQKADHDIAEHATVEISDHCAQLRIADLVE